MTEQTQLTNEDVLKALKECEECLKERMDAKFDSVNNEIRLLTRALQETDNTIYKLREDLQDSAYEIKKFIELNHNKNALHNFGNTVLILLCILFVSK